MPWLLAVLALVFLAIGWRLVDVQALSARRYEALGREQRIRRVTLAAERGTIFDRHGNELALSVAQETVWADPRVVEDPAGYARRLAPILAGPARERVDELESVLRRRLSRRDAAFVYVARKVEPEVAARVEDLGLPGVAFVPESQRHYPTGVAASVLGLVGLDNQGLGGLELRYERLLAGQPGELVVERDPEGREIPQGRREYRPPVPGADLVLTIDQGLQFEAERALVEAVDEFSARGGRAIVVDVRTGDILAMANVSAGAAGAVPDPATDRNRAVTDLFEPGSTNKVITIAAALEEGLVAPTTAFTVPDHLAVADHVFSDNEPHPTETMTVTDILRRSSNVGAILIGKMVGKHRLDAYLRAFGFGSETGLDFPGEPAGLLLDPADWYPTSMGTVPIGNGLAVTALQMLDVYVTIANGGVWREPRLVKAIVSGDGRRREAAPGETRRVISPRTARLLTAMLEEVVTRGTGTRAAIPGYRVAGKTGTAKKPLEGAVGYSDRFVSSFVGFAPADDPRVAAIVVLDEPVPIYGGVTAAPTFARIVQHALRLQGLGPDPRQAVTEPSGEGEAAGGTGRSTEGRGRIALGSLTADPHA